MLRSQPAGLVLLTAPAGYSKTTCLAEWAAADPRPFAWVAASGRHDDPAVIIASIVEAVAEIEPIDPDVLAALAAPRPSISSIVLPRMGESLGGIGQPFVLAIDDAHLLTSAEALATLEVVIGSLPPGSQLALASRTEPPLPLGRIRAHRRLFELGEGELAMTRAESGELLGRLGLELTPSQLDPLFQRTEGWPAALYLAGLALADQPDMDAAIASFAGDDRIVSDYLRDEFVSTLTPTRLRFLTRTAVLDQLSGPLCDAVLERTDSARVLRELGRSNSLVIPLDRRDDRYRYHHLFAEHLLSELRHREHEIEPELHARASRWYEAHADVERAIDHAIAAGEVDRAGELIWLAVPELTGRGRLATLERMLDQLGGDVSASSPTLALASAHRYLVLGNGEQAAHWARATEAIAAASGGDWESIRADILVLKATLAIDGAAQMGRDAASAAELHPPDSPWQTPCFLYRGVSSHLMGDRESAITLLQEGVRRGSVFSPPIQVLSLAQLCLIAIEDDDWPGASRLIAQAREQASRCGLTDYPLMAFVFAVSALVRSHQGQVLAAHEDVEHAMHLLEQIAELPSWYEAEVRLVLSRAYARVGDQAGGHALVEEASRFVRRMPDAPVLTAWLNDSSAILESSTTFESRRGEFCLTKAELRTLQYLPSHLSFPEIAERIHVSTNTVKTQARALYRKLDVSSRGEAVEKARDAGLLGEEPPLWAPSDLERSSDRGDAAVRTDG